MPQQEFLAAKTSDFQNGDMKEVTWNDKKIILAKTNNQFYAVGSVCPHYKAPLIKGALCGTRLYCPWHHSSFDITNGNLCDPPALDGLPHYSVRMEGENIFIGEEIKHSKPAVKETAVAGKMFVLLGGGAAGMMAAQTLRLEGFDGRIVMITRENILPYDRPALSKKVMSNKSTVEDSVLRPQSFFEENNIAVLENKNVEKIDINTYTISFSEGDSMTYDRLLLATGGEPNELSIAGSDLPNVLLLRTAADAERIVTAVKDAKKIALIGASFIALEVAASLHSVGKEIVVFSREDVPFASKFGKGIGTMFLNLHREKGITIITGANFNKIDGFEKAEAVVLENGNRYETDAVIVGVGVHPVTDYVFGIDKDKKDNSILVNEYLQAANDVFAAGDIARFPTSNSSEMMRVEHWRLAQQHGIIAAKNMLDKQVSVKGIVPFFWTNQYDARLNYVGHAESWDEIVFDGKAEERNFIAYYVKDGKVVAAASMKRDKESMMIEDLMRNNAPLSVDEMKAAIS